uniref:Uncharacterized protein n=1 Tax=Arundo donax TaxID=35708 RepID=A0A0A9EIC9_ARUDO
MWFCTMDHRKMKLATAEPNADHLSIIAMPSYLASNPPAASLQALWF